MMTLCIYCELINLSIIIKYIATGKVMQAVHIYLYTKNVGTIISDSNLHQWLLAMNIIVQYCLLSFLCHQHQLCMCISTDLSY